MWFKIVDKDRKGRYKTLFHGIGGSKVLPMHWWLEAERKFVRDGSTGTQYESGWHIMMDYKECCTYLSKFTDINKDRVIVMVDVMGRVWPKEHSPSNVYLCDYIMIMGEIV